MQEIHTCNNEYCRGGRERERERQSTVALVAQHFLTTRHLARLTQPTIMLHFSKYEVIFHLHSSKHILRPTCRTDFICANLVAPFKSYRMVLFLWSSEGANKNVQRIKDPGQSSHDRAVCVQQLLQDEWNKIATPISYGGQQRRRSIRMLSIQNHRTITRWKIHW